MPEEKELFIAIKGGKGYTIEDIEALPKGERAELIDGEMFRMDTPSLTHQDILVKMDCERKVKLYREAGVREYWIVDAERETVIVYEAGRWDEPGHHSFSGRIKAGIFDDLYLRFSDMDIA